METIKEDTASATCIEQVLCQKIIVTEKDFNMLDKMPSVPIRKRAVVERPSKQNTLGAVIRIGYPSCHLVLEEILQMYKF